MEYRMANWVNGYFTGIDYISEFYGQYAPSNIEAVRLFQRQSRITSRPAFRHFELGCGHGLTSIILAACYPEASFTANDFLPQHVASARALAKKLGLSNVTFIEASFDELNQQNYQPFDYILSHGVYTWVAENSKQAIREFVAENLASTGVFSLRYNCKAGWAELDNLVEIFRVFATQHADHQIEPDHSPTLEKIKALFRKNRGFFKANGRAAEYLRQLIDDEVDPKYLFHERLTY